MIVRASSEGEFLPLGTQSPAGVATNAAEEAFSGFLANWKRLDEKTPQDWICNKFSSSQSSVSARSDSTSVDVLQKIGVPVKAASSISRAVAADSYRSLSTQSVVGTTTRVVSVPPPVLRINDRFQLAETETVTHVTKVGSRSEHTDAPVRFEWRKTAVAGIWSGDGVSLTLRDYGIDDADCEHLLAAVRSTLSGQGIVLNRLTINGKNLFQH